jgi:hypothetical protein
MSSDAPKDGRAVVLSVDGRPPPARVPYVLKVSPIDAESSGEDKFYYDPFADLESSDFAAARAFFLHHGHVVIFHDCPDAIAFQQLFPQAEIRYISSLPAALIAEGHQFLATQRTLIQAAARPSAITPPRSIVTRYVAAGFRGSGGSALSPSTTTVSSSSGSGLLRSASVSSGGERGSAITNVPPPRRVALRDGQRPDPEGDNFFHVPYGVSRFGYGGPFPRYGGSPYLSSSRSSLYYGTHPRHGGPPVRAVPPYVFPTQGYRPPDDHGSHATASIASSLGETDAPRGSLLHPSRTPPTTSEITLAFSDFGVPSSLGLPTAFHGGTPSVIYGGPFGSPGLPPAPADHGFHPFGMHVSASVGVPYRTSPTVPVAVVPAPPTLAAPAPGPVPVPPTAPTLAAPTPGPGPPPAPAPGPGSSPPSAPAPAPVPVLPRGACSHGTFEAGSSQGF